MHKPTLDTIIAINVIIDFRNSSKSLLPILGTSPQNPNNSLNANGNAKLGKHSGNQEKVGLCPQSPGFASLADSQLNRPTNPPPLGRNPRFSFANEKAPFRTKPASTFGADEAFLMPVAAKCRNDHVFDYRQLAALTLGRCATRMAL
jgi:hypothetical protein